MQSAHFRRQSSSADLFYKASAVAALLAAVMPGCKLPGAAGQASIDEPDSGAAVADVRPHQAPDVSTVSASEPATPASLDETLAELRAMGELDEAGEQQLRAELEGADPSLYPLIVRQFQAAVAYRKQLAERETEDTGRSPAMLATRPRRSETTGQSVAPAAAPETRETQPPSEAAPASEPSRGTPAEPAPKEKPPYSTPAHSQMPPSEPAKHFAKQEAVNPMRTQAAAPAGAQHEEAADYSTNRPTAVSNLERPQQQNTARPPVRPVSYTGQVNLSAESRTELPADLIDEAIKRIEAGLPAEPSTADEVNSYLRLRLLQLAAGRESEAFRPVPGATPAQHDYWSSQLYALRTFLDAEAVPHAKQRSSATLTHLDDARDKLSELATMQVRNLHFVDSVGGYGDYTLDTRDHYKPGEQVMLYAELANFRSESSEEGYKTSLGTSYEVLDESGRRVDGGQFPDVDDRCENRRRDFHLQYSVPLPTRIYPGEYELRLVISDHLSHKIGQASAPFRIAE